ncbi:hypothetical protein ACF3MZ_31370 [Paenibacillaceae bacterium WGS1546]|uniref:hypothetical protein n=1 Tax=Cohnella sp. WGS1546 TaxID=3366810 RepID=UPI00372CFB7C
MTLAPTRKSLRLIAFAMAFWMWVSLFPNQILAAAAPDTSPPPAPTVTGVEHQATYGTPVIPNWVDEAGTTSSATLSKDGEQAVRYLKGTPIEAEGNYVLIVMAKKSSNGLTASTRIHFTIDSPPEAARISIRGSERAPGVYSYAELDWTADPGTTSEAILKKEGGPAVPYAKNTRIAENGNYALIVTTTKLSNGLTAVAAREFTIDLGPIPPEISGTRGYGVNFEPVTLSWTPAEGTTVTETILVNQTTGETFNGFPNHSTIVDDGSYLFYFTVLKTTNGMTSRASYGFFFLITGIRGVADGGTYRSATPNWTDFVNWVGGRSEATLSRNGGPAVSYGKGTTIDEEGQYVLTVTWHSLNGIRETQSVRFTISN